MRDASGRCTGSGRGRVTCARARCVGCAVKTAVREVALARVKTPLLRANTSSLPSSKQQHITQGRGCCVALCRGRHHHGDARARAPKKTTGLLALALSRAQARANSCVRFRERAPPSYIYFVRRRANRQRSCVVCRCGCCSGGSSFIVRRSSFIAGARVRAPHAPRAFQKGRGRSKRRAGAPPLVF